MPKQSLLRFIRRWRRYQLRAAWSQVPKGTRGVYALYRHHGAADKYEVAYLGIAGVGKDGGGGIRGRLKRHHTAETIEWTHYSAFEVHDNVTRDEIREFEALLLGIFRHDPRIRLANKQRGSKKLYELRKSSQWDA
jgi:hypothetical protein